MGVLPFDQEPLVTSANPRRRPDIRLFGGIATLILTASSPAVIRRTLKVARLAYLRCRKRRRRLRHRRTGSSLRRVPAVDVPDHSLTPGRRFPVVAAQVCVPGYASSVRHVTDAEKARVYARYGIAWVPYQHEIDHLISLELGGSNAIRNLWPEPYAGRWGARTKDVLENRMHTLVCSGQMSLGGRPASRGVGLGRRLSALRGVATGGAVAAVPRPIRVASTPRATRRPPRSTAPTTPRGTICHRRIWCTSRRTRRPSTGSPATTCTSPAD